MADSCSHVIMLVKENVRWPRLRSLILRLKFPIGD